MRDLPGGSTAVEMATDTDSGDGNMADTLSVVHMVAEDSGVDVNVASPKPLVPKLHRVDSMDRQLRAAAIVVYGSGDRSGKSSKIIPLDKIQEIVSPSSVTRELEAFCRLTDSDRESLIKRIFAHPGCRKIFAILALVDRVKDITIFVKEGLSDSDLPFYTTQKPKTSVKTVRFPKGLLEGWHKYLLELFEDYQWMVLAPVFDLSSREINHYVLDDNIRLPFLKGNRHGYSGGYSNVWRVRIHRAHHISDSSASEEDNPLYAVKQLRQPSATNFNNEVSALRRLSGSSTQHLIRLLATYEHMGAYHMIFPWAGGNLVQLWRANPRPDILSASTATWFKDQLLGLAEGLRTIHRLETTDKSTASTTHGKLGRVEARRMYGRHGDLKPENILYFPKPSSPLSTGDEVLGRLVISDFGLTAFMHGTTSLNTSARTVPISPTYRPPESDIGNQLVSQRFDIWSLGCLLLEFASWMLAGWDSVVEFANRRVKEDWGTNYDSNYIKEDKFFIARTVDLAGANESRNGVTGILKPVVLEWSKQLLACANCTGYMTDLISLIMNTMLQVHPTNRITADNLFKTVSGMNKECSRDSSYFCRPGPGRNICHLYSHPGVSRAGNSASLSDPTTTTSGETSTAIVKQSANNDLSTSSKVLAEKRRKLADPDGVPLTYSCPFRKRNPLRFNVREYQTCALSSFPDISQVKRHIQNVHGTSSRDFSEDTDHKFVVDDPESRLSVEAESKLRDRRTSHKVLDWDSLWTVLFPNDTMIPTGEYEPVIEDHEVHHRVIQVSDMFRNIFSTAKPAGWGVGCLENDVMPTAHVWPIIETVLAQHFDPRRTTPRSLPSGSSFGRATAPATAKTGNRHTTRTRTKSTRSTVYSGVRRNTQTRYEGNRYTTEPLRQLAPTPSFYSAHSMILPNLTPVVPAEAQCRGQAMLDADPMGLNLAFSSHNEASNQIPAPPAMKKPDNHITSSKRKFEHAFPEFSAHGNISAHTSQLDDLGSIPMDLDIQIPESVMWNEMVNDQDMGLDVDACLDSIPFLDTSLLDSHIRHLAEVPDPHIFGQTG